MNLKRQSQLSLMMFLEFFVWGTWFVTMWRYLGALDFSGTQVGAAYSTTGWAALISPFLVGMIADRFFAAEKVMAILHLLGAILMYWVAQTTDPSMFFVVLLAYTITYMPTLSLSNAIAFEQMTNPEKEFPPIRVLGTIGWIAAGLVVGFMPRSISGRETIENTNIPMLIAAGVSVVMGLFCLTLPHTPPKSAGKKVGIRDVLGLDALALLKNRSFAVFTVCSLLICIPLSFYYQSANGFLDEMGFSNPAATMTLGQASEIFFMLAMPLFFARLGVKYMLLVGMGAWLVRYGLFASQNIPGIYIAILLHGICYDFFFVTGQIYVDQCAPQKIRAGAQGFLALITLGLGMIIGNLVNGVITDHYTLESTDTMLHNWKAIWTIPAAMAVFVMALFALFFKYKPQSESCNSSDSKT